MATVTLCHVSVRTLKETQLKLSAPNLVVIQCIVVAQHALTCRSKCRDDVIIKCTASVGLQVNMTALVSSFQLGDMKAIDP